MEQLFREIAELKRRLAELETQEKPGIWTDWTPTVTQSGSVTVTVSYARYFTDGKKVDLIASLAVTGTGTIANPVVIGGLPAALSPASGVVVVGIIRIFDTGTAFYVGAMEVFTATSFKGFAHLETDAIGIDPSFALANGDLITFQATYERA